MMSEKKQSEQNTSVDPKAPHKKPTVQPEKYAGAKEFDEKKFADRELDGQKILW